MTTQTLSAEPGQPVDTSAVTRGDEEDIRLATGFADIFIAIVLVLAFSITAGLTGVAAIALIPLACFALAKPLVKDRNFAASANVLAASIVLSVGAAGTGLMVVAGLFLAAGVSWLFWKMYRVPLAMAMAWAGLVGGVVTGALQMLAEPIESTTFAPPALFLGGLVLFGLGVWYDAQDRDRVTRRSDIGFWLHLIAAVPVAHGAFWLLGFSMSEGEVGFAPGVIGVYVVFTVVALVIDRRAIMASSFLYLVVAVGSVLWSLSADGNFDSRGATVALAPGIVGIFLLVLAGFWTPMRNGLLAILPDAITRLVPPPAQLAPLRPREVAEGDVPPAENEPVRLILGFNDLFVALGAAAFFIGVVVLGFQMAMATIPYPEGATYDAHDLRMIGLFQSPAIWLVVALPQIAMWGVAEYFVRIRRMAWPAIVTALLFWLVSMETGALFVYRWLILTVLESMNFGTQTGGSYISLDDLLILGSVKLTVTNGEMLGLLLVAVIAAGAMNLAFWWRHRVPISFALALAAAVPLLFVDIISAWVSDATEQDGSTILLRFLIGGVIAFVVAMMWDRRDPARTTQRADVAFWLHVLASVLIIPAGFAMVGAESADPLAVFAGFALVVLIALVIDRRAAIVVALPFAVAASASGQFGEAGQVIPLGICVALLALALKWDVVRGWIFSRLGFSKPAAVADGASA